MTKEQYEEMYNWVYEEIHHNRDSYSRSKIIAMIMHKAGKLVNENNDIHDVTNCYCLTEEQKKKMDKHKANEVKFSHGSGIGVSVEVKTKKGKWKDITDYSCW